MPREIQKMAFAVLIFSEGFENKHEKVRQTINGGQTEQMMKKPQQKLHKNLEVRLYDPTFVAHYCTFYRAFIYALGQRVLKRWRKY
jgi:hypothetical protein